MNNILKTFAEICYLHINNSDNSFISHFVTYFQYTSGQEFEKEAGLLDLLVVTFRFFPIPISARNPIRPQLNILYENNATCGQGSLTI